jgi:hypothetical protein
MKRLFDRLNAPSRRVILAAALVAASSTMHATAAKPASMGDLENVAKNGVAGSCAGSATSATSFQDYNCNCLVYTVPTGKIFVMETISGAVSTAGAPQSAFVSTGPGGGVSVPIVPNVAPEGYTFFAPAKAYYSAGSQISIVAEVHPDVVGELCIVSTHVTGYLVND